MTIFHWVIELKKLKPNVVCPKKRSITDIENLIVSKKIFTMFCPPYFVILDTTFALYLIIIKGCVSFVKLSYPPL